MSKQYLDKTYIATHGGGTDNYNDLSNKPSINSVTLSGNKSASDLSLASASHSHTKSDISDFPSLATVATTGDYDDLSDKPSIPTKTSDLTNDSGFITGYTETDPVFSASASSGISSSDISNWNGKSTVSLNRKTTSGTNIADITINGTTTQLYAPTSGGGGGSGTVTSVGITNGGGLSISGSPVTSSGNITVGHSNSVTAGTIGSTSATSGASVSIPYATYDSNGHITGKGTHTHTITGFVSTETDPVFSASAAAGIASSDITNWNNKSTITTDNFDKDNISVPSGGTSNSGYADGTITVTKSGYTPVAVVGFSVVNGSSSGSNGAYCFPSKLYIRGNTVEYRIQNRRTQAAVVKLTVYVLYTAS